MSKQLMRLLALFAALTLVAAACGSDDDGEAATEAADGSATETADEEAEAEEAESSDDEEAMEDDEAMEDEVLDCAGETVCVGLVTDVGKIDDKSFNQSAWEGVQLLEGELDAHVDFIETQDSTDYAANIGSFVDQDYDVIVTVGFALGEATGIAADENPDTYFIGVDQFQGEERANVAGLIFPEDQAGFLAGALAGLMTESNIVGQVLGTDLVPPVVAFKEGFDGGVAFTNPDAEVIATYHPGGLDVAFTDPEWGANTARQALDNGADVIFAAGGLTGNGGLAEIAKENGEAFCIGVDTDQWETVPEAQPCLITSAMKLITPGIVDIAGQWNDGSAPAGNYIGDVGLADYHDFSSVIPQETQDTIAELTEQVLSGEVPTGYTPG
ncbi:MAG: BMP family ABC transporter substrate-binding protein [Actinomycetota bacterium]